MKTYVSFNILSFSKNVVCFVLINVETYWLKLVVFMKMFAFRIPLDPYSLPNCVLGPNKWTAWAKSLQHKADIQKSCGNCDERATTLFET